MLLPRHLLLLTLWLGLHGRAETGGVVGGHEAAAHSRPYMALLAVTKADGATGYCGGFLLTREFVMTAAHCQASNYTVYLGLHSYRRKATAQKLSVTKSHPHQDYDDSDFSNDIMLLKLSTEAEITTSVKPIALETADVAGPCPCAVSGWGQTQMGGRGMSLVLMEGIVKLTDAEDCAELKSYCSKGATGPGEGDSGGPLVCGDGGGKAYGVISSYNKLSQTYYYTKISNYVEWLDSILKNGTRSGV
uniref:trypsin n=1 Tax=Gasterosteus aculeatus aculeatus TaxID=481459 RepID=G3PI01_GASAC|nr:granzyme G-like [Gasterosteus aculeatus aculeatus]